MNGLNKLFTEDLRCVNLGLEIFCDAAVEQGTPCVQVEWKPPSGGDPRLLKVLEWLAV